MRGIYILILFILLFNKYDNNTEVTVDLNSRHKVESLVGFLHWRDIDKLDKDIAALKPIYWRFGVYMRDSIQRAYSVNYLLNHNIKPIIVLSDFTSLKNSKKLTQFKSSQEYYNVVKSMYNEFGNSVIYDMWNEPDKNIVLKENPELFFDIFKKGYGIIRRSQGGENAIISGPSTAGFNKKFIYAFLDYCKENNLKIDILNWHDAREDRNFENFKADILEVQESIKTTYKALNIKKIILPEIIGKNNQYSPNMALNYFSVLEDSGIKGTCKACWLNEIGESNCTLNNLDGLINTDGSKRSIWWAYRYYAKSTQNRLKSTWTQQSNCTVISSLDEENRRINIIINNRNIENNNVKIKLMNSNKLRLKKIEGNLYHFPESGESRVDKIVLINKVSQRNTSDYVNLGMLKKNNSYLLSIAY